ncbi:VOC family protein [Streptomyces sp. NBC_01294]|uniref:VOC family protein n=1 Tax=Streptomyces sp. NBC_01294 TaxID=2903815 RepID=UPI002DD9E9DC|nr:VOC family protein [Streptomyces sp. NBC_01294]WRZ55188.1 VOC family protein [Streptomyces sp. NBC_01294]WRZ62146.1 VOC family protein [Streptomyces sp. NBC_01294]
MSTQEQSGAQGGVKEATVDMKLEVHLIPVADVDRALSFYQGMGWRLDADFEAGPEFRIAQLTPPGSECSIIFGRGVVSAPPGSADGYLVVYDLDKARADLVSHGVEVSEIFHKVYDTGAEVQVDGRDPDGRSYASYASFSDPDGNGWLMQEVQERLPGR